MSSTVSATPFALEIKPSRRLAAYLLSTYAAAALVVFLLPVSIWMMCIALPLLAATCAVTYRRRVSLRDRHSIVGLTRTADGSWQLRQNDTSRHRASLLPDSYLHPELLVLNFRLEDGKRRSVVLMNDSADSSSLRRLRVALALGVREAVE